jgi:hypothetical protein
MEQQKKKSESHGVEVFLAWQPNQEVKPPPQWKQKPRFAVGADKKVYFRQATSMSIARWLVRRRAMCIAASTALWVKRDVIAAIASKHVSSMIVNLSRISLRKVFQRKNSPHIAHRSTR